MSVRQLWAHFGSTISSEPHRSLAAFLGHKPSAILLSNAGLPLLHHENCAGEEELDPNPHELELPDEYLQTELLIRSLAFWGWDPLVRAANACSEHQLLRQEKFDATAPAPPPIAPPASLLKVRHLAKGHVRPRPLASVLTNHLKMTPTVALQESHGINSERLGSLRKRLLEICH